MPAVDQNFEVSPKVEIELCGQAVSHGLHATHRTQQLYRRHRCGHGATPTNSTTSTSTHTVGWLGSNAEWEPVYSAPTNFKLWETTHSALAQPVGRVGRHSVVGPIKAVADETQWSLVSFCG